MSNGEIAEFSDDQVLYLAAIEWIYACGLNRLNHEDGTPVHHHAGNSTWEETSWLLRDLGILAPYPDVTSPASRIVIDFVNVKEASAKGMAEGPSLNQVLSVVAHLAHHLFLSVGVHGDEGIQFDSHPSTERVRRSIFDVLEKSNYCFKEGENYIWTDRMKSIVATMWTWPRPL